MQRIADVFAVAVVLLIAGSTHATTEAGTDTSNEIASRGYDIPLLDLANQKSRQVVVDQQTGQYLGHPTTVLLEDGRTMIAVYPKGHGRGPIVMKRSTDGGLTWSPRLPVPDSWATSKETPTIHRVVDPKSGAKRLLLFSGLYPIRMAFSDDDGRSWSDLTPIGDYGGIVAMASVMQTSNGDLIALFHDDGRFIHNTGTRSTFNVYQIASTDGGMTWSEPKVVATHAQAHLCEPGLIQSPDGRQLAMLLRENSRAFNSFVSFSDNEGATWSEPRELPGSLTGDRHTGRYGPDGRLFISFRDTTRESPSQGDWVGWVGTYDDIREGREGQYRVRLMDNHHRWDCAYPGIEVLPDGTFVTTTYGHWDHGEQPYVVSVRFTLDELDAIAARHAAQPSAVAPLGFSPLFNGQDLTGWKGLVENPIRRAEMAPGELLERQRESDAQIARHWRVEDGEIINDGHGPHLCTERAYQDFELQLEWKISPGADSGVYLRGTPQVQIWDPVNGIDQAKVGSGGLYNNQRAASKPLARADRPAGQWNRMRIHMVGELVTVWLNGEKTCDAVPMENYWDRARPVFASGQIELQTHGGEIRFRNLFIREIGTAESNHWLAGRDADGFVSIFNGRDLSGWAGSIDGYFVKDTALVCDPEHGGILYTDRPYDDFVIRFEFSVPPGGNNGLAIRAPGTGDPAYVGMEVQVLDNTAEAYQQLQPYQYHGSVYGLAAAHRGYQRPIGEWNFQEVVVNGHRITVRLNGTTILEADLATMDSTADGKDHPGMLRRDGLIGFMGHGHAVKFRNIMVKPLR